MLQLTKNSGKYHSCLQCGSAETYELRITREDNNSGLTIDLCGDCLDKLSSMIQNKEVSTNGQEERYPRDDSEFTGSS